LNPTKADCDPKKKREKKHTTLKQKTTQNKLPAVEERGQETGRRHVKATSRHRCHPDRGPTPKDRKPPRSARKKRRVAHTSTKQRRAHWRVGTTRRSPATDRTGSCGSRGERRWRTRLGGACQSEVGEEEQIWHPKSEEKVKERATKHPADNIEARPFPQRRQLEMNNPAKQKKQTKKDT
jgi:hypothetical protein